MPETRWDSAGWLVWLGASTLLSIPLSISFVQNRVGDATVGMSIMLGVMCGFVAGGMVTVLLNELLQRRSRRLDTGAAEMIRVERHAKNRARKKNKKNALDE